jgi:hypothetical protein
MGNFDHFCGFSMISFRLGKSSKSFDKLIKDTLNGRTLYVRHLDTNKYHSVTNDENEKPPETTDDEQEFRRSGPTGIRTPNQRIMSTQFVVNKLIISAEIIIPF